MKFPNENSMAETYDQVVHRLSVQLDVEPKKVAAYIEKEYKRMGVGYYDNDIAVAARIVSLYVRTRAVTKEDIEAVA